jgi:hypothetical protein
MPTPQRKLLANPDAPREGGDVAVRAEGKIVVRPDQVSPSLRRFRRSSARVGPPFEWVVGRFVLISAAGMVVLLTLAFVSAWIVSR